jgi:tRNA-specific 2-thiouridylase
MRIVVGMSGGVDSAVAAWLLKNQGYDVIGIFMKNWEEEAKDGVCTAESDWADVRACCDVIGIPYYSVNFTKAYQTRVFDYFLDEYRKGRTPNPDVLCNREIKFKAFLDFALQLGAERIATGHFARTDEAGRLYKGLEPTKEQSYFLYMLKARQLQRVLFPLGEMSKEQVRAIAADAGLPVSNKKDSTGICFIGERDFNRFLAGFLSAKPGPMITDEGQVIGRHNGLMYYTIGQRKGLGIGGRGDGRSFFVLNKDMLNNALIVGQGEDHPGLYSTGAALEQMTWVNGPPCEEGEEIHLAVKMRYRQSDQGATMVWRGEQGYLLFDTPQRALTPGQSAVLYRGDECLGGGIIEGPLTAKQRKEHFVTVPAPCNAGNARSSRCWHAGHPVCKT